MYFVEDYWQERGKSGYLIWRYRLVSQARREPAVLEEPGPAPKVRATVQRLVRSTAVVQQVKALYGNTCQVCQIPIAVPTGRYAEGAHIRPLGHPHDGPDVLANVLCLCPNDHVRFDYGAIWLDDHLCVVDAQRGQAGHRIHVAPSHHVDLKHVRYHRDLWQGEQAR